MRAIVVLCQICRTQEVSGLPRVVIVVNEANIRIRVSESAKTHVDRFEVDVRPEPSRMALILVPTSNHPRIKKVYEQVLQHQDLITLVVYF